MKEVPEIDSYISPSPSKRQQKNSNQSRVKHGQSKELKSQESRISGKNRKTPKADYRDSAAYSSNISAKKTPKVVYEEIFGYKNPETGKYPKHTKTEKKSQKKSPKENGQLRAAKYYKFKNPKTGSKLGSEDKDSYPYSSANNWKLNKNSPEKTVPRSNVRQLPDSGHGASFYGPSILSGRVHSLTNEEILRDLTGIWAMKWPNIKLRNIVCVHSQKFPGEICMDIAYEKIWTFICGFFIRSQELRIFTFVTVIRSYFYYLLHDIIK